MSKTQPDVFLCSSFAPEEYYMVMKLADGIFCDLRHGVKLEIYQEPGKLKVQMVGDFLAKGIEHFKHHRDALKTGNYKANPFCLTFSSGRGRNTQRLATMQAVSPSVLMVELWLDAVISGYTSVNSVEQMIERLDMWQKAVAAPGESLFLREVVGLLDKPGGDLQAMQMMLKYDMARALDQGFYKPGQVVDVMDAAKALDHRSQ
jgi:hypothetical protein